MNNPISEYYRGRDIFVTGGSGLVGKAVLEKILRSCPGVNRVFILLRKSKGKQAEERLEELKSSRIFDRLKQERPFAIDKLIPITGDLNELGLGMSEESIKMMEDVSFIFHIAATIRFDEPLRNAIIVNVRATREALNFAMNLKNLCRFVHVSTTYCYPYLPEIGERLYPAMGDWEATIKMGEQFDGNTLDALTHKVLGVFPNTYTYTKHLAEQVVNDYSFKVPVLIIRPSIVAAALSEPYEGWFDKAIAAMAVTTLQAAGIVRTLYCKPSVRMDVIPLDVCIKVIISMAWWVGYSGKNERMPVYNVATSSIKPYSMLTALNAFKRDDKICPFNKMLWVPNFTITDNIYFFYYRIYVYQVLPAVILDLLIKLAGKKPFMLHIQRRALSTLHSLQFFLVNDYTFHTILNHITEIHQYPEFTYHLGLQLPLSKILMTMQLGARRYILNESDDTIPQARKRYEIIAMIDLAIRYGINSWIAYYVLRKFVYWPEILY